MLREERISAGDLRRSVRNAIDFARDGYLLFDETVVSKPYGKKIESVRRQWSGSEKRVIEGIGIVPCVYVNPETRAYWIIDYRIYDVDRDGKTKLKPLLEMLRNAHFVKRLPFESVSLLKPIFSEILNGHGRRIYLDRVKFLSMKQGKTSPPTENSSMTVGV